MTTEQLEARVREHFRRQVEDDPASVASSGMPAGEIPDFFVEQMAQMIAAVLPEIITEARN